MHEQTVQVVEHFEVAHQEYGQIEGQDGTKDYDVWVDSVVACWVPDLDVCHYHDYAVDVCASNPEASRVSINIIDSWASLKRLEPNNLEH